MFGSTTITRHSSAAKLSRHMIVEKPNAKNSQWSLRVLWNIPGYPNGKEYTILRQHAKEGPVSADCRDNSQSSSTFADSLDVRDCQSVRGSTTYIQNAMEAAAQMNPFNLSVATSHSGEEITNNVQTLRSTIKNTDSSKKKAQRKCRCKCVKESIMTGASPRDARLFFESVIFGRSKTKSSHLRKRNLALLGRDHRP